MSNLQFDALIQLLCVGLMFVCGILVVIGILLFSIRVKMSDKEDAKNEKA